jgi:hypothetical protein
MEHIIKSDCEEHFLSRSNGFKILWMISGVWLMFVGSSVAWALVKTAEVSRAETQLEMINKRLDIIDIKLDTALKYGAPPRQNP